MKIDDDLAPFIKTAATYMNVSEERTVHMLCWIGLKEFAQTADPVKLQTILTAETNKMFPERSREKS